jgi:hypothetical protein
MSSRAVESMKDSYTDKVIEAYNEAVKTNFSNFPAECIRVLKSIHEELAWSEEGSLITSEQAGMLWEAVQETAQSLLEAWEPEVDN